MRERVRREQAAKDTRKTALRGKEQGLPIKQERFGKDAIFGWHAGMHAYVCSCILPMLLAVGYRPMQH